MTYSIVARHPVTGELGVAAQSHYPALGVVVPWARAGVGVVATQATALPSYGPLGLDALGTGGDPEGALAALVAADADRDHRQVALVDATGRVAVHTGTACIVHASHVTGDGYSVQGNMLRVAGTPDRMAAAWEASVGAGGSLPDGLLAALDAAEAAGGDVRGRQSAALVVVGPTADPDHPWAPPAIGVRVDDHATPLVELRRLVGMQAVYTEASRANELVEEGRVEEALALAEGWSARIGGNPEPGFWLGRALLAAGHADLARPLLRRAEEVDPGWADLGARLDATDR